MPLTKLTVRGYRSLRDVFVPLQSLNVVTGPNGSGKSNLYRALWLIAQICEGEFAQSICREGGLLSVMWAGPRLNAKKPVQMSLGFSTDQFSYEMVCGYPVPRDTLFWFDPEIKEESVWFGSKRKPSTTYLERAGGMTRIRDIEGNPIEFPLLFDSNESALSQLREPHRYPELSVLRETVRDWRFYHVFRTDADAPIRNARVSARTPLLSHDGSDLAAALQTILEDGDGHTLMSTIAEALPGRSLQILSNDDEPTHKMPSHTELTVGLRTEGCVRPLMARELSDGTLKFLCLTACLLSPRPPGLIALNEPESSLHPDLLAPLARLIVDASRYSQIWVSTHSLQLTDCIRQLSGIKPCKLTLCDGETMIEQEPWIE